MPQQLFTARAIQTIKKVCLLLWLQLPPLIRMHQTIKSNQGKFISKCIVAWAQKIFFWLLQMHKWLATILNFYCSKITSARERRRLEDANAELEDISVKITCTNCLKEISTRVVSGVSPNGYFWAILCCCCGSWLLSLFVCCMKGFKEFVHCCPSCNAIIGTYRPKHPPHHIFLLLLSTAAAIALNIILILNLGKILDFSQTTFDNNIYIWSFTECFRRWTFLETPTLQINIRKTKLLKYY